ncbi:MAG: TonB-dependent receptor [Desulfocapsaceae bacterium]|nr:TonB-dependent receptor [Desulfocapsaceae bacterium]
MVVTGAVASDDFLSMELSELMKVTVTSVSKKEQDIFDAAAAIYVITQKDIRRSGVTSIPEALRMAPGLQVARVASNKWAISSRGLGGQFSNKLLVLVDGRTVYTPGFSNTYWDAQNTLLEDVDRIEVIRGPGATLWGANAVNGVINIITKDSADTLGGLVTAGTGNKEEVISGFRYGGKVNSTTTGRVYIAYNQRDSFDLLADGSDANDDWNNLTAGFRLDGEVTGDNSWTLQGDLYSNQENQTVEPLFIATPPFAIRDQSELDAQGGNIKGNWEKQFTSSALKVQLYFDYVDRDEVYADQTYKTTDVDIQYDQELGTRQNLSFGAGYRYIDVTVGETFVASNIPDRNYDLFSAFVQDTIEVVKDRFWLTLGTKWEHNEFTGHEFQPSGRVLWKPKDNHSLWASISRAVRTPSLAEVESDVILGFDPNLVFLGFSPYVTVSGSDDFDSEEVIAFEAGYRWLATPELSFDLALFYNDYEDLLDTAPISTTATPADLEFVNAGEGYSYGFELAANWQARQWLEFALSYSYFELDIDSDSPIESSNLLSNTNAPKHQVSLRSSIDFAENWQANIWLRYVGELEQTSFLPASDPEVDDYLECDLNIRWQATEDLEFMLVGQNLFDSEKLEYVAEQFTPATEVETSYYLKVLYRF